MDTVKNISFQAKKYCACLNMRKWNLLALFYFWCCLCVASFLLKWDSHCSQNGQMHTTLASTHLGSCQKSHSLQSSKNAGNVINLQQHSTGTLEHNLQWGLGISVKHNCNYVTIGGSRGQWQSSRKFLNMLEINIRWKKVDY